MCHACVTDAVKNRMLSRRDLFRAAPAAAAVATVGAAPAALAAGHQKVVDLTHTVSPAFPTYFGAPGIAMEQKFNFADNGFNLFEITLNEHTGTHIDAPLHFSADGQSVDEIPVENLVCPLCVIHIHEKAADDREAQVTPDDLKAWISKNGDIPDGAVVAMHSGWASHTGTHIDAPLHFSADGQSVDEIPVENLVCPLCVIHIHEKAADDREAQVTPDDLKAWISKNGDIPDGAVVAMHSGWASHIGTPKYRGEEDGKQHYPGFHVEAAQMLLETGAVGLAADTLSLDVGSSQTFDTHYAWLPQNRWGIENIANLDAVPAAGATLIVGAPKHEGGSGGPARILALV
ncbi:MAG: cyclase family protein [Pseudomonadota bacterium]